MTTRILHDDELWALDGTDLGMAIPFFPKGTRVIVAEIDGQIVGHIGLVPMLHVEGIEVHEQYRGKGVKDALIAAMHAEARALGQKTVFPASADRQMTRLLQRLGAVEIPAKWFALRVKES